MAKVARVSLAKTTSAIKSFTKKAAAGEKGYVSVGIHKNPSHLTNSLKGMAVAGRSMVHNARVK